MNARLLLIAGTLGCFAASSPKLHSQTPATAITVENAGLGTDGFARSGEVKIHFVTSGTGPLVVMVHGFPDYWFTWRKQIPALAESFQVVAIDQRGYNKSDQPVGVENYTMDKLVGDVVAVVRHFEREKAIIVGHDWGGMVAWSFAMAHPEMTDRLVILNLPHPNGPYAAPTTIRPPIKCPVLMFHGLKDKALLPGALNDTWNWVGRDLTLVTIPDADHFVQQDAPELVTRTMVDWLKRGERGPAACR